MAELILDHVYKRFDDQTVVEDLSLLIPKGAFTALLGPSGCGKTTTLRMIAGLESISQGRLSLGDRLLADGMHHTPAEERHMSMVFQSYALWPHMTVAENVGYPLKLKKVKGEAWKKQVMAALEVVELGAYAHRSPQDLSGGQRQRVALARCLVSEPDVVLLDEPLANLDRHLRATMEQTFREFHRRTGATFVYVTHDQAEAMALASHVAVLHQGKLMQWGAPEDLYQQPNSAWVASFVGQGSILNMLTHGSERRLHEPQLQQLGLPVGLGQIKPVLIRPEHVQQVATSGIPVQVQRCIFQGERYWLQGVLADGQLLTWYHSSPCAESSQVMVRCTQGWVLD